MAELKGFPFPVAKNPLGFFYEQNTEATKSAISNAITDAIATWEPRITVQSITVTDLAKTNQGISSANPNRVLVRINYINPEQINIVENLVLAIPFEGG